MRGHCSKCIAALVWTLGMVEILVPVGCADQVPNPPFGMEEKLVAFAVKRIFSPLSPVPLLMPGESPVMVKPFA